MSDDENKTKQDAPMHNNEADATAEVAAANMNIKLQPFWPENPENWFLLTEIQFDMQHIKTEKQKYQHVLPALPASIFNNLTDLLRNPPKDNQYTYLKNMLLNRLAPSDERQLETLLSGRDIGDRRPSEVLRHIRELARDNFPDKMIRSLWSRKMPNIIRIAIAAQPEITPTDTLAETADRMFETMSVDQQQLAPISRESRPRFRSSSILGRGGEHQPATSSNTMEDRLARVEVTLERLQQSVRNPSRNRSQNRSLGRRFTSRSQSRNNSRSRSTSKGSYRRNSICWYHRTFGAAARQCSKPCSFGQSSSVMDVDSDPKN